jgi:hypothetical protein
MHEFVASLHRFANTPSPRHGFLTEPRCHALKGCESAELLDEAGGPLTKEQYLPASELIPMTVSNTWRSSSSTEAESSTIRPRATNCLVAYYWLRSPAVWISHLPILAERRLRARRTTMPLIDGGRDASKIVNAPVRADAEHMRPSNNPPGDYSRD